MTAVDDPDAFALINSQSLVFYTNIDPSIDYFISQGERPAAFLTDYYQSDDENPDDEKLEEAPIGAGGYAREILDSLSRMFEGYIRLPIGGMDGDHFWEYREGDDPKYKRFQPWQKDAFLFVKKDGVDLLARSLSKYLGLGEGAQGSK